MSESSESGQSSLERLATEFQFSGRPSSKNGPETVINPESPMAAAPGAHQQARPGSSVWKRLFPHESVPEGETPPVAPGPKDFLLEHFAIQEQIGAGGMGAVFRAVDQRLDRIVALKVLGPAQSHDTSSIKRFQNEARAAARLDHDNIARVFYVGEDQGVHFIAYEFVTGTNIRQLIRQAGQLDPAEAVNYTLQVAAALKHTSAAGVVHRDIKPSNIIICPNGRAKIVDLGLARKEQSESVGELTMAGTTLGTFDYISPEQAKDPRNVDVRSDIYSLGCTLYHMVTGSPPYAEGTVLQKLLDHQGSDPPDPSERNRRVSPQLSAIIKKMMASNPEERYQRPDDVLQDLLGIAGALGLRSVMPEEHIWATPQYARRGFWERNVGWIATSVALLVVVLFVSLLPSNGRQANSLQPPPSDEVATEDTNPDTRNHLTGTPADTGTTTSPGDPGHPNDVAAGQNDRRDAEEQPSVAPRMAAADDGKPIAGQLGSKAPVLHPGIESPFGAPDTNFLGELTEKFPGVEMLTQGTDLDPLKPVRDGEGPLPGKRMRIDPAEIDRPVAAMKPLQVARGDTRSKPASEPKAEPFPPAERLAAFTLNSGNSGEGKPYPTLEAACREARDGDIIELNYNGLRSGRSEKPLHIGNKRIVIRAGKDSRTDTHFRPGISFDLGALPPGEETRAINLARGTLQLINVDIWVSVGDDVDDEAQWALVSLSGSGQVGLRGSSVTFLNPKRRSRKAAVFELTGSQVSNMSSNPATETGARQETRIELAESFVRGHCDFVVHKQTEPARIEIEHTVLVLTGSLLNVSGSLDMPSSDNADLELHIEHVTCAVGNSLIRMDSGEESRDLLPVSVSAHDNIIIGATTASPLIAMTGNTSVADLDRLLAWEGSRNCYDGFERFWSIQPMAANSTKEDYTFDEWQRRWGSDEFDRGIVWMSPGWFQRDAVEITPKDMQLDDAENPAVGLARDGTNLGANLTTIEAFSLPTNSQSTARPGSG